MRSARVFFLSAVRLSTVSSRQVSAGFSAGSGRSVLVPAMRSYHTSLISLGPKGGKKGAKKGKDDDDAQDVELPSLQPYQASIARSIAWLQAEFDKNKFGSITPEYFQSLSLPGHGALGKLGQITVRSGAHLSIAVYDTSLVSIVVDAVRGCGLGLNPVVDGSNVTASVPRATKETRDLMVKNLSKLADKVRNRWVRSDAVNVISYQRDSFRLRATFATCARTSSTAPRSSRAACPRTTSNDTPKRSEPPTDEAVALLTQCL